MFKLHTNTSVRPIPEPPSLSSAERAIRTRWENTTWASSSSTALSLYGMNIWSHNGEIYYSRSSEQYKLNKDTMKWETCSWVVGDFFDVKISGSNIFEMNGTAYLLYGSALYYLPAGTTTNNWKAVTTNFVPTYINDIWYNSYGSGYYVYTHIDASVSECYRFAKGSSEAELVFTAFTPKLSSTTITYMYGRHIKYVPVDIEGTFQPTYIYRGKCYSTFNFGSVWYDNSSVFSDPTNHVEGSNVWTNGNEIFAVAQWSVESADGLSSTGYRKSLKLNLTTLAWDEFEFKGGDSTVYDGIASPLNAWTDGNEIYYSSYSTQLKLSAADINPCYLLQGGEWVKQNVFQLQNGEWVQISFK